MIETPLNDPEELIERKVALLMDLHETPEFEGEKIDFVLCTPLHEKLLPIQEIAYRDGVEL